MTRNFICHRPLLLFILVFMLNGHTSHLAAQEGGTDDSIDLNKDGISDISYEYVDTGYYELIDRNFDGKVDQSSFYDISHYLISARSDDDFDGYLETKIIYKNSLVAYILTDADNNQLVDLVLEYKDDLAVIGHKFYKNNVNRSSAQVGKVQYRFGYPTSNEQILNTSLTEEGFHEKYMRIVETLK